MIVSLSHCHINVKEVINFNKKALILNWEPHDSQLQPLTTVLHHYGP